jgi:hypothetical protein
MKMIVSVCASIAFCLVIAAPLAGQDQKKRGQAPAVPSDGPGPVHERLGTLAGTWEVALRYKLGDKEQHGKANCEAKLILDGRFLQQDYNSRFQGKPFHVVEILGYDKARKRTIEIMMDNLSTSLMHNEGSISDDGKVITNMGASEDPITRKPYKLRTVTTIVDHDHFTLEWFRTEAGGSEERVVTMTHTRKKP